MGLLDTFQRKFQRQPEAASDAAEPDAVAAARTRARRRLIGATVLLAVGIIGFPLLFETQPRPIPVDVPIEIPQKDKAPPLVLSPAPGATVSAPSGSVAPVEPPPERAERVPDDKPAAAADVITERAADQGREVAPKASEPPVASKPVAKPADQASPAAGDRANDRPSDKATERSGEKASEKAVEKARAAARDQGADAERAQALLEGRPAAEAPSSAPGGARIVVQAGAYTDPAKLREARAKVEKLGLRTYTQVVDGEGGKRTRVRVGPFATKAEAEKAAAKLRAAGLQANLLTL